MRSFVMAMARSCENRQFCTYIGAFHRSMLFHTVILDVLCSQLILKAIAPLSATSLLSVVGQATRNNPNVLLSPISLPSPPSQLCNARKSPLLFKQTTTLLLPPTHPPLSTQSRSTNPATNLLLTTPLPIAQRNSYQHPRPHPSQPSPTVSPASSSARNPCMHPPLHSTPLHSTLLHSTPLYPLSSSTTASCMYPPPMNPPNNTIAARSPSIPQTWWLGSRHAPRHCWRFVCASRERLHVVGVCVRE